MNDIFLADVPCDVPISWVHLSVQVSFRCPEFHCSDTDLASTARVAQATTNIEKKSRGNDLKKFISNSDECESEREKLKESTSEGQSSTVNNEPGGVVSIADEALDHNKQYTRQSCFRDIPMPRKPCTGQTNSGFEYPIGATCLP